MGKPVPQEYRTSLEDYKRQLEADLRDIQARIHHVTKLLADDPINHPVEPLSPMNGDGPTIRSGMYKDLKMGQALLAYLNERGTVPVTKVAIDLTEGGVVTLQKQKTPGERVRRIRITIGNNKRKLVFDPVSDTVKLREEERK